MSGFNLETIFDLKSAHEEFEAYALALLPTFTTQRDCWNFAQKWHIAHDSNLGMAIGRRRLALANTIEECKNVVNGHYKLRMQVLSKSLVLAGRDMELLTTLKKELNDRSLQEMAMKQEINRRLALVYTFIWHGLDKTLDNWPAIFEFCRSISNEIRPFISPGIVQSIDKCLQSYTTPSQRNINFEKELVKAAWPGMKVIKIARRRILDFIRRHYMDDFQKADNTQVCLGLIKKIDEEWRQSADIRSTKFYGQILEIAFTKVVSTADCLLLLNVNDLPPKLREQVFEKFWEFEPTEQDLKAGLAKAEKYAPEKAESFRRKLAILFEAELAKLQTCEDYTKFYWSFSNGGGWPGIFRSMLIYRGEELLKETTTIEECMAFLKVNNHIQLFGRDVLYQTKKLAADTATSSAWFKVYDLYFELSAEPNLDSEYARRAAIKKDLLELAEACAKDFNDYYGLARRANPGCGSGFNIPEWQKKMWANGHKQCRERAKTFLDYFRYWRSYIGYTTDDPITRKMVEMAKTPEEKMMIRNAYYEKVSRANDFD